VSARQLAESQQLFLAKAPGRTLLPRTTTENQQLTGGTINRRQQIQQLQHHSQKAATTTVTAIFKNDLFKQ